MRRSLIAFLFLLFVTLFSFSCARNTTPSTESTAEKTNTDAGSKDGTTNQENNPTDQKLPPKKFSIVDVQDPKSGDHPAKGQVVQLKGVVVVSPLFVASTDTLKGFFVMDPSAPKTYGGVLVVVEYTFAQKLELGDVIDIEGVMDEYFDNTQINASSGKGGFITKTAENKKEVVKPIEVTADDFKDPVKAELYEGMFVELKNAKVTEEGNAGNNYIWTLNGSVKVGYKLFRDFTAQKDSELKYVRGVVYYTFSEYQLLPRMGSDIDTAKPQCTKDADCNAGSTCNVGWEKCYSQTCTKDADCKTGEVCETTKGYCQAQQKTLTISDLQDATSANHPAANAPIEVKNALVTSPLFVVSKDKLKGFFVTDSSGVKKNSGILVVVEFAFAQTLEIGDEVTLVGNYKEFYFQSQIEANSLYNGSVTKTGVNSKDKIVPLSVQPSDVPMTPADKKAPDTSASEPYEGVLIELKDVVVQTETTKYGETVLEGGIMMDNDLFDNATTYTVGQKISVLRGVLYYSFDTYRILPRFKEDITLAP